MFGGRGSGMLMGNPLGGEKGVVMDMGFAYTKIGFVGDAVPLFIVETEIPTFHKLKSLDSDTPTKSIIDIIALNKHKLQNEFQEFIAKIYFFYLKVNPKSRSVFLIETLLTPRIIIQLISDVLFRIYEVPTIYYLLGNILPLYLTEHESGLILDMGFIQTQITPICQTETIIHGFTFSGHSAIEWYRNIMQYIREDNPGIDQVMTLTSQDIQEVVTQLAIVVSARQKVLFFQDEGGVQKMKDKKYHLVLFAHKKNNLGYEDLMTIEVSYYSRMMMGEFFFENEQFETTLPELLLQSILKCPLDNRRTVASNIILTGGTICIPGFKSRLLEELKSLVTTPKYNKYQNLKNDFDIPVCIFPPNGISWSGGSIVGQLKELEWLSMSKSEYKQMEEPSIKDLYSILLLQESGEKKEIMEKKNTSQLRSSFQFQGGLASGLQAMSHDRMAGIRQQLSRIKQNEKAA